MILDDFDVAFEFTMRLRPVLGELRPVWRIALLLLILSRSRGQRSNLLRLHVLGWSIRDQQARQAFLEFLAGERKGNSVLIRLDPTLNRALQYAAGEGLVDTTSADRIALTDKGKRFVAELDGQEDVLAAEKAFLAAVGRRATQEKIAELVPSRRSA